MLKISLWRTLAAACLALVLAGCGGGNGSSAAPPSGFTVTPGNGQVVISWQAAAGVDYWLMYAATASAIDIKNPPANHVWATTITSPFVVSGLTNGVTYSFAMNGRTGGGAGGAQTASLSAVPRAAGSTWLAGTGAAGNLRGVSYGSSTADSLPYFLAVGDAGALYKSAENVSQSLTGYGWSPITVGPAVDFKSTTYAYSRYVAVGANGAGNNISSSADLASWTAGTFVSGSPAAGLNAVASNGTTLVAVGNGGAVFYSTDAVNWTAATVSGAFAGSSLSGVAYAPGSGIWVAVGAGGALLSSSDGGLTWSTPLAYSSGGVDLRGVAASSGNVYVAVGVGGAVFRSTDAATWTLQTPGPTTTLNAVSTDSVQFVAVGAAGKAFTSADGITWTAATSTGTTADLFGVLGSASKYMAVGLGGATVSSIN